MKIFIYGSGFIARNLIEYLKAFDKSVQIILAYNKHKIIVEQKIKQFSMNDNIENILIQEKPDGTMKKLTDVSKLNSLGWKYKMNLESGIKEMYKWYLQ